MRGRFCAGSVVLRAACSCRQYPRRRFSEISEVLDVGAGMNVTGYAGGLACARGLEVRSGGIAELL